MSCRFSTYRYVFPLFPRFGSRSSIGFRGVSLTGAIVCALLMLLLSDVHARHLEEPCQVVEVMGCHAVETQRRPDGQVLLIYRCKSSDGRLLPRKQWTLDYSADLWRNNGYILDTASMLLYGTRGLGDPVLAYMVTTVRGGDGRGREYLIFAEEPLSCKVHKVLDVLSQGRDFLSLEMVNLDDDHLPEILVAHCFPIDHRHGGNDLAHTVVQAWKWSPGRFRYVMVRSCPYPRRLEPLRLKHFR